MVLFLNSFWDGRLGHLLNNCFMSGPFPVPTSNKGVEERLDLLRKPHWTSILSLIISIGALIVAILAWQRPVKPTASENSVSAKPQTANLVK
jgi:hypothetical protein